MKIGVMEIFKFQKKLKMKPLITTICIIPKHPIMIFISYLITIQKFDIDFNF